jgi:hypothetical protein
MRTPEAFVTTAEQVEAAKPKARLDQLAPGEVGYVAASNATVDLAGTMRFRRTAPLVAADTRGPRVALRFTGTPGGGRRWEADLSAAEGHQWTKTDNDPAFPRNECDFVSAFATFADGPEA